MVACVSCISETNDCFVFFVNTTEELCEPGSFAEKDDENAGGKRIESARVSNASLMKNATRLRDHVMRS